jgi:hypothetical protein
MILAAVNCLQAKCVARGDLETRTSAKDATPMPTLEMQPGGDEAVIL